jgi:hypothetical protein
MARSQEIVQQASPIMFSDGTAGRGWGSSQSSYASPGYRVPVATQQDDGVNARLSTAALYELLRKKAEEEASIFEPKIKYVTDAPSRNNELVFTDVLTGKDLTKDNKLNRQGQVVATPGAADDFVLKTSVPNEKYNALVKSNLESYADQLNRIMGHESTKAPATEKPTDASWKDLSEKYQAARTATGTGDNAALANAIDDYTVAAARFGSANPRVEAVTESLQNQLGSTDLSTSAAQLRANPETKFPTGVDAARARAAELQQLASTRADRAEQLGRDMRTGRAARPSSTPALNRNAVKSGGWVPPADVLAQYEQIKQSSGQAAASKYLRGQMNGSNR